MKLSQYLTEIAPKFAGYSLARKGLSKPPKPIVMTYSVTAACRSLCRTCNIGRVFMENPKLADRNLTLEEVEKVFKSMGYIYFFNISGGEPFMRMDLPEIIKLAAIHLKPKMVHIPTNALAPRSIERMTEKILDYMDEYLPPSVPLSVKPSIDGIGDMHDYVRGIPGNFRKLEETIDRLLALSKKRPRLHVDLGTVISNFNIHHLDEIENWVHSRGVESYRHEIAEQRVEFHNVGEPITPPPDVYEKLTNEFRDKIIKNIKNKAFFTRTTEAIRVTYYKIAADILKQGKQVSPCFAGLSNIHMNYNGDIWPCCVLGADQNLGNVRDFDYDIPTLLNSEGALTSKKYIADKKCACPLANQWLTNIVLTPQHMLRAVYTLLVTFPIAGKKETRSDTVKPVDPSTVRVNIVKKSPRKAIVLKGSGTLPQAEDVDLPEYGSSEEATSERVMSIERVPRTIPVHKVHSVETLTDTIYLLRVEKNGVAFRPGQYFIINIKGCYDAREYTVFSSPDDEYLEFLIVAVDGGIVSNQLKDLKAGDELELEGPMGYFLMDEASEENGKQVYIATGTGISPFASMIKDKSSMNYQVIHGMRYGSDTYALDHIDPENYIACVSRDKNGDFHGRVTDYLRNNPIDTTLTYHLCGNADMLFEVYDMLVDAGVPRTRIRSEVFY